MGSLKICNISLHRCLPPKDMKKYLSYLHFTLHIKSIKTQSS